MGVSVHWRWKGYLRGLIMTINLTIEVTDEAIGIALGKLKKARPVWHADGVVFWVLGTMNDAQRQQASAMALYKCREFGIPAYMLKEYSAGFTRIVHSIETKTRRMDGF